MKHKCMECKNEFEEDEMRGFSKLIKNAPPPKFICKSCIQNGLKRTESYQPERSKREDPKEARYE